MSLRNQFFASVLLALFVSLSFLGATASWHTRQSVQNEMRTALMVARRNVQSMLASLPHSEIKQDLTGLVHSFDGNRHVRVEFRSEGRTEAVSHTAAAQRAPDWFVMLLQIPEEAETVSVTGNNILALSTDPSNEIGEAWAQYRDGAVILGLFGIIVVGLLHLLMTRTAARLKKLATGFDAVGGGDYGIRLAPEGPSEIFQLANAFNRMTDRLSRLEAANRTLNMQMLTIQEEERADLARDLHDEMGPFLFAMRVDAEAIDAQAHALGQPALAARARAVGDAVTHIQQHVRLILKQLQPADVDDIGLSNAIANLAAFWQRYHVGINIHSDVTHSADGFGEMINAAIYRLVQESLTNAVRHGKAQDVSVTIELDGSDIRIHVEDNGTGLPERPEAGMGLRGMEERVTALGGTLTVGNRGNGNGAAVTARIPLAGLRTDIAADTAA